MATITLRTQSSGIRPQFEHETTSERRAAQSPIESGVFFRRQINERERRRFRLEWPLGLEGQRYLLTDAWESSYGGALPMNYTPVGDVDGNAIEVKFVPNSLSVTRTGPKTWRMGAEIEESL